MITRLRLLSQMVCDYAGNVATNCKNTLVLENIDMGPGL